MDSLGYSFLVERFGLDVCEPCVRCERIASTTATVRTDGWREERGIPARSAPKDDSWQAHLSFALKHEGANFEVLKAFFAVVPEDELRAFVLSRRTGRACRRAGFFYEWLTGRRLDIPDLKTGNYVPALDGARQAALRARSRKPGAGRAAEPHGPARPPDFAERERSAPPVGHAGRSFGPRPSPGHEPGLRPDTKEHESHYPARTSRWRGPQKPLCWA